ETFSGDVWSVAVTPNDGYGDGETVLSNELTINTPPTVELKFPEKNHNTTNRLPTFNWSGTDIDGDGLTYQLNLTCFYGSGLKCIERNRNYPGLIDNYTLIDSLECLYDFEENYYYNWSVRAYDGGQWGPWATPRRINIYSMVSIVLKTSSIDFGSMQFNESNDTTNGNPGPFVIENDGNVFVNVTINGTNLWITNTNPTNNFTYKIDNYPGESSPPAFTFASSQTSWSPVPSYSSLELAIAHLNWSNATDTAKIDVFIRAPGTVEPPGSKQSTIYFTASLDENPQDFIFFGE
ncbi:MAG: hypothetical protein KKB31_07190, partial [Nanoarchaeota archaeon]|nr:hypothetical protein [Nanoarchaeota archaeon]